MKEGGPIQSQSNPKTTRKNEPFRHFHPLKMGSSRAKDTTGDSAFLSAISVRYKNTSDPLPSS